MSPNESILVFLIVLAIFGLIVGAIARLLVPGPTPMGLLGTMAAGIAGAFVGGFVGKLLFGAGYTPGWIMSILGAVAVVALVSYSHRRTYSRRRVYGPRDRAIY
ncbi:MAG TPA: GlsB/YeaQ/YmgE family stress response membrane protein [Acidimicrobiales bacterium]|jgi:uncharacterized membrane protein YeaQ/YmgE (transglycosylase-associated protein family)